MITGKLILSSEEVIEKVFDAYKNNYSFLLTYLNQHSFNTYFKDGKYRDMLDKNFNVYQADSGMYLFLKYLKKKNVRRTDGTNLNEKIINKIIEERIPIVIIGGKFTEQFIKEKSSEKGINLNYYHHGYFNETEYEEVITKINSSHSHFIFIGMGVPEQEYFAQRLNKEIKNKIIICTGNFFEFYFGSVKRAPLFFRKAGLEWIYRLFTEPKRLWRRYIFGIPEFIYRVLSNRSS